MMGVGRLPTSRITDDVILIGSFMGLQYSLGTMFLLYVFADQQKLITQVVYLSVPFPFTFCYPRQMRDFMCNL